MKNIVAKTDCGWIGQDCFYLKSFEIVNCTECRKRRDKKKEFNNLVFAGLNKK